MTEASSIVVTIRRVTTEVAQVIVPITEAIATEISRGNGQRALADESIRLGVIAETNWIRESDPIIDVHPIQKPIYT